MIYNKQTLVILKRCPVVRQLTDQDLYVNAILKIIRDIYIKPIFDAHGNLPTGPHQLAGKDLFMIHNNHFVIPENMLTPT